MEILLNFFRHLPSWWMFHHSWKVFAQWRFRCCAAWMVSAKRCCAVAEDSPEKSLRAARIKSNKRLRWTYWNLSICEYCKEPASKIAQKTNDHYTIEYKLYKSSIQSVPECQGKAPKHRPPAPPAAAAPEVVGTPRKLQPSTSIPDP